MYASTLHLAVASRVCCILLDCGLMAVVQIDCEMASKKKRARKAGVKFTFVEVFDTQAKADAKMNELVPGVRKLHNNPGAVELGARVKLITCMCPRCVHWLLSSP